MEKEFLTETRRSVTLNVTGGKIDSFREKEETTGTIRVYENGCIGVAGCLGTPDEASLTAAATEALGVGIPYPCELGDALEHEDLREGDLIPVDRFIPTMQEFLDQFGEACPRFAFSNKIGMKYRKTEYHNSKGRHLTSSGSSMELSLLIQNRGSGNLMDSVLSYEGDHFDANALLSQLKSEYDAYYTPADIENGVYPIVLDPSYLFDTVIQHFTAEMYISGASLLSGRLGQQLFAENLSLSNDMNPATNPGVCFFDGEGCVAPDFRPTLIDKGTLTALLTTKKSAKQYGLPNLGTAAAYYDSVPTLGFNRFYVNATAPSLSSLVPGRSIYVVMASGGDTTPEGHFATPVQLAYLMENGKLIGRLPDLNISGSFYDMLSKNYLGAVHNVPQPNGILCAVNMKVTK